MNPSAAMKRLDAVVGVWRTEGLTVATDDGPAVRITGSDTYEWLPGGHFLLHHVDVTIGGQRYRALEVIGEYNPVDDDYVARAYDSAGDTGTMTVRVDADGVWTIAGHTERATLVIDDDGSRMAATWERSDDDGASWRQWMDMNFSKS